MIQPRKEVLEFAKVMETKLSQHDDRPHWDDEDMEYLEKRFDDEVVELKEALRSKNPNHIVLESGDVGNMAMALASRASKEYKVIEDVISNDALVTNF